MYKEVQKSKPVCCCNVCIVSERALCLLHLEIRTRHRGPWVLLLTFWVL